MAMESALGWIGDLARYFGSWFPHPLRILATHRGVRFFCGKYVKVLEPGFYWYIPALTEIYVFPVVEQTDDLPVQSGCTKDCRPVAIGGLICYRIWDIRRALVECFEISHIIRDRSLAVFNAFVSQHTFEEIVEGAIDIAGAEADVVEAGSEAVNEIREVPGEIESARWRVNLALTHRVRACLWDYGVDVIRAQLTHFGPCQTFVHVGQTAGLAIANRRQDETT